MFLRMVIADIKDMYIARRIRRDKEWFDELSAECLQRLESRCKPGWPTPPFPK